jgi:Membrane bound FAD containing D-sorbitol dehydrogenase
MYKAPMVTGPILDAPAPDARPIPLLPHEDHAAFLSLSAALTGFSEVELLGTGVAKIYHDHLEQNAVAQLHALLDIWGQLTPGDAAALERRIMRDQDLAPFAQAIILLWYTATWTFVPAQSVAFGVAFPEALVWKLGDLHPTASKPPGFGSWADPPVAAPPR